MVSAANLLLGYIYIIWLAAAGFAGIKWAFNTGLGAGALRRMPPWHRTQPLGSVLLAAGSYIILASAFSEGLKTIMSDTMLPQQIGMASAGIITIVFLEMYFRSFHFEGISSLGLSFRNFGSNFKSAGKFILTVYPFISLSVILTTRLLGLLSDDFQPQNHPFIDDLLAKRQDGSFLLASIAAGVNIVLVAPFVEETIFRGLVQSGLNSATGRRGLPIVITSAIFAVVHGAGVWTHWPSLMLFSLVLGYAYEKKRSLTVCILLHSMFNFISLAMSLLAGDLYRLTGG
ncbi:CAAX amino terminal protease self- immunity [Sedimentisphaera cyanobacteriorum]|uniref:CAAX amino terminal protease self-immunity n=1 Tax=Sedimentisphaera cyanobacteriorum TaxID=1940790 RepID=A0A1Q2HPI3_9BACT|nr:CPBP family intramembrane glutamic endopeptidase [Sedimentisphaera cyanobacteriorum]AQQ09241.1 CAAX amino terminal protease self- immunity [Sedimentisphaera cyanobacteriorum]